jgi:hypothetical protein
MSTGGDIKLPSVVIEFVCVPQLEPKHLEFIEWYGTSRFGFTDWGQSTYNAYAGLQAWVAHESNA